MKQQIQLRTKDDVEQMLNELNGILDDLNEQYHTNCGGCCAVAAMVAEHLEKFNISYKVDVWVDGYTLLEYDDWVADERPTTYSDEEVEINIKDNQGLFPTGDLTANHYTIVVGDTNINAWENVGDYNHFYARVSSEDLMDVYNNGDWNPTFDPGDLQYIEIALSDFFKQYSSING